ncbi:BBP7 family outer membrane beta-barrel protein [Aeoliella sp. ICT_H6.2]|uniref:BBP7 family outer membrane beta-barrel protein n=1 Tax=Aeoliella straminimaris TaxID=2954799 RepID=A0A9X2FEJ5_9BACT|nr:BBP7 family outer membrane beta-barrel protein [Aeoliella straminimaris]MCO6047580.1 BBP7 family outer membrane beta-barrel protein [Aeoliella straminimaris]
MLRWNKFLGILAAGLLSASCVQSARAQATPIEAPAESYFAETIKPNYSGGSSAYPNGDYQQQLQAAGGACGCDVWGCGGSPFRTGPGCGDDWLVGPRWRISLDGVMLYRETTNLAALAASMGTTLDAVDQHENFDHGVGARLMVGAWWPQNKNFELVMGYVGVDDWNANIVLPVETLPPVIIPPISVEVDERRTLNYNSSMHAMEINFQALNDISWKPYAGIRYFSLDEVVEDRTNQYETTPLSVTESSITRSILNSTEVKNNLIGFQLGMRRDQWRVAPKLYIEGFTNAGVYCNVINRSDVDRTTLTSRTVLEDDPGTDDVDETGQVQVLSNSTGNRVKTERTEMALTVETSLALVWKMNNCCALRGGYQLLYIDGVELGDNAFLGGEASESLLYHGCFAGFEYRR